MKAIAALLLIVPAVAFANPPVKTWGPDARAPRAVPTPYVNTTNVTPTVNAELYTISSADASSGATASIGNMAPSSSINVAASRLAQAPDVISYPTAPCRISVGVSGGWIGGAIGVSSSTLDENCQRIETSRQLFNMGEKAAAVQVMCLSDEARMALEATGVKCLIEKPKPQ